MNQLRSDYHELRDVIWICLFIFAHKNEKLIRYLGESNLGDIQLRFLNQIQKQIEAIVKTIQADTQDAVAAMEKSTVGVVEGTKLSDAAGQALTEIQRVSRELAELISRISAQTQMQSTSVSDVTRGMQGILKISEETTEGTKQTNVSIGQLTKLAADLRSSVAGFKV